MQMGFAFLEAGNIQVKHVTNILMKVVMNSLLAALGWWACGFAFAYGTRPDHVIFSEFLSPQVLICIQENYFIGSVYFFDSEAPATLALQAELDGLWFFMWAFCAACATILSGLQSYCSLY